ncbi:MAG: T9SS type A sorting domain-containing protein [Bacteroidota bacterium]
MKKNIILTFLSFIFCLSSFAQFQGSFTLVGSTLSYSIKPVADITTAIAYIEFNLQYPTNAAPSLTVGAPVSNSTNFPSISIQRLDGTDGPFTNIKFVHNTSTIASKTYTAGTEYEVFTTTLNYVPTKADSIRLASDFGADLSGTVNFTVLDGGGNLISYDPTSGTPAPAFYGPSFALIGTGNYLPLFGDVTPVKFTNFSATKKDNSALLAWQITNEDANVALYEVERSVNGINFTKVASIAPKNNGFTSNTYNLNDDLSNQSSIVYYRIKQLDKDGKFTYTEIRSVRITAKGVIMGVYPNPVKSVANLSLDLTEDAAIFVNLTDAAGKEIKRVNFNATKGLNVKKIDMTGLASGSYLIKVQAGTELKTISVVKAN